MADGAPTRPPAPAAEVVTLGETLACLAPEDGGLASARLLRKSIGGAESNTAVGLSRLGHLVTHVSRVGDDPFGREIVRTLRGEGVDVSHVTVDGAAPTGVMFKDPSGDGEPVVHYYRRDSAATRLTARDVPRDVVAQARRVHVSGITLALGTGPRAAVETLVALARDAGVKVSFDPNHRTRLWSMGEARPIYLDLLAMVDDLLLNESEALELSGRGDPLEAARRLLGGRCTTVVIKRGARGVLAVTDRETIEEPARAAGVVDTVGAGDGFNAGYLHARLGHEDLAAAVRRGSVVAARVVRHPGDYEGLPRLDEHEADVSSDAVATP